MNTADLEGWEISENPFKESFSEKELDIPKLVAAQIKKKAKAGGFQAMGLSPPVIHGILRKGYRVPTPIQRRVIPVILDGKDVVAMARTGSGKTAAFLIPLFDKLKMHSAKVGVRAIILSPTRELALQTLAFAKDLGKFTGLRAATILGGESMENQFAAMHNNPDIIIATPGRFTHICVEMNLKMNSVKYVVFDEADILFEMGFQEQLNDIINRLPQYRQTLLFSATLPKMLVEFARAGLNSPTLIRLDEDTKISENLKLGFFKINSEDKVPLLIHLLKNVIDPSEMNIVFAPTKHHVEYLHNVLNRVGIPSTYVYSSLDASARKINVAKFRAQKTNILIVTDLAARGIDIPLLDNVINFNFPPKVKLFVHRVGRVARGSRNGTAYSFVAPDEVCYLLELHMFLSSRSVRFCPPHSQAQEEIENWDRMYGRVPQDIIDDNADCLAKMLELSQDLRTMKNSTNNAIQEYVRTRPLASAESIRRLKEELWGEDIGFHPIFKSVKEYINETERLRLLDELRNVRSRTTIFDIKKDAKKGPGSTPREAMVMRVKRDFDNDKIENYHSKMERRQLRARERNQQELQAQKSRSGIDESSEIDILTTFDTMIGKRKRGATSNRPSKKGPLSYCQAPSSSDFFIPYAPRDQAAERGYSVKTHFQTETTKVTLDFIADDDQIVIQNRPPMKWDRKQKKFVRKEQSKKIKTESGAWVSASYSKNLYEKWKLKMQPHLTQGADVENAVDENNIKRDWRGGKTKGSDPSRFLSLTESSVRYKAHPLLTGKKFEKAKPRNKGVQQLRTYEERVKYAAIEERRKNIIMRRRKSNFKRKNNTRKGMRRNK